MTQQRLGPSLARDVGFDLLESNLARDLRTALAAGLRGDVIFTGGSSPRGIFQQALATAVGRIHEDGRAPLFLRFLKEGPYERWGRIPSALRRKRLSDEETASVIRFIHGHMVNCFKGVLTEMLAVAPCLRILRGLKAAKRLPSEARLYVGDTVWSRSRAIGRMAKGADLHIMEERKAPSSVAVLGVVEVKSYLCSPSLLHRQLDQHLVRARRGLQVNQVRYTPKQVAMRGSQGMGALRISVLPSRWTLPRTFRFEAKDGRRFLYVTPWSPPALEDALDLVRPGEWRITLRWSKEALEAAAYGMTFWFMKKVGEILYSNGVPKDWAEMTPAEAGQNAAKMMLSYAILRARTAREHQRAIALYNSYGFSYALGMNYRDAQGRREMLWPQDLDEILAKGKTKEGCRIT